MIGLGLLLFTCIAVALGQMTLNYLSGRPAIPFHAWLLRLEVAWLCLSVRASDWWPAHA